MDSINQIATSIGTFFCHWIADFDVNNVLSNACHETAATGWLLVAIPVLFYLIVSMTLRSNVPADMRPHHFSDKELDVAFSRRSGRDRRASNQPVEVDRRRFDRRKNDQLRPWN
jgi:hypothetical protein